MIRKTPESYKFDRSTTSTTITKRHNQSGG